MRSANTNQDKKPVKQRYLPALLASRMRDYGSSDPIYDKAKTITKVKAYIERHRHHPEYLNAVEYWWFSGSLLRWAMDHHLIGVVELMLSCDGVDVNIHDNSPQTAFHSALRRLKDGDYLCFYRPFVMALLNYPGIDATSQMYQQEHEDNILYPLTIALQAGKLDVVKKILEFNGHPEKSLSDALKIAIDEGYLEIVNLLLQKNVVVGESHLGQAMDAGNADIVATLLNYQPLVVDPHSRQIVNALIRATQKNNYPVVKLLVDKKLDVGVHILTWAAWHEQREIVDTLLSRDDFNVNETYKDKENSLCNVIVNGHGWAALRILERRKDVRVNDHVRRGDTALMLAAKHQQQDVMASLLARPDIEVDAQNDVGDTALHHAAMNGNATDLNILLDHHANPNIQNAAGETPLITAVMNGKIESITALMAYSKTDMTIMDNLGKSALMYAAEKGLRQVVISLLSHDDSNVNAQDNNGDTALILAARSHDDANIIKELLAHRADEGIANELSHTALMVAEAHHRSLCPLLNGYLMNHYQYQQAPSAPPLSVAPSAPPLELAKGEYDPSFFAPPVVNSDVEKTASSELRR